MRPQSGLGDFYREIGALFGVVLAPHNRWAGFKALREKWLAHVDATRYRPVLLIDEAQEMSHAVLAELRILASTDFDFRAIITVVLGGDGRLVQDFRRETLLPIASRIRVRLNLDYLTPKELLDWLRHALDQAGNPHLMTPELMTTLAERAAGPARPLDHGQRSPCPGRSPRPAPARSEALSRHLRQQPRPKSRTAEPLARA